MSAANPHVAGLIESAPARETVRRRRNLRQILRLPLMIVAPLAVAVGALYVYATGGRYVATDDAYVQAARVGISADIAARVTEIAVHDNQTVRRGDLLFRLDQRSFRIAIEQATAQLAAERLKIQALKAMYGQRQADLKSAQDTLDYQQREFDRQKRLLGSGIASQAQFDQANHSLDVARQMVAATQQQIAGTLADLGGTADIDIDKHPAVMQAQAVLDRARLNLSYTEIRAPEDGIVTKVDQLQIGEFVNAATPVFSLISTEKVWIEANFKETDLTHMHPGETATISVDSFPDAKLTARVASLSPGTGSTFALLPPENATGNWVKVVQRLPVRLELDAPGPGVDLHAGMSADVSVDTHFHRPLMNFINTALGASK